MVKKIAVIGGSGLEELASGEKKECVSSENGVRFQYFLTTIEGVDVVYVPRHGAKHQNSPLDVPYDDIFCCVA